MNKIDLLKALNARRTNSAWTRGVLSYALEIVCIGTRADDILNAYSFPELIDLPQEA